MTRIANKATQTKRHAEAARARQQRSAARLIPAEDDLNSSTFPASLGNTLNTLPVSTRAERWSMRVVLNRCSSLSRLRKCGRVPIESKVFLRRGFKDAKSGFGGLATCGSVWACPVCSAKIAAVRREEVATATDEAIRNGFHVSMLTLTQRHHKGQRLDDLWAALSYAWGRVTSGRRWQEFKEQLGLFGYIKATEVTHGRSGWHVHLHVLIFSEDDPSTTAVVFQRKQGRRKTPYPIEKMMPASVIAERWKAGLAAKNVDFIAHQGGLDWQTARDASAVSQYVTKLGCGSALASEATLGAFKKARTGNRTPFQIFADYVERKDESDLKLWHQWEQSSRGKRALVWSHGLRDWAGLKRERTDEEIAEDDLGGEEIAFFRRDQWKKLWKIGAVELLEVLDNYGVDAALAWLDDHRIRYYLSPFYDLDESPPDT